MSRALIAAAALALAAPAYPATVAFSGTQTNDTPPPGPSPLCGVGRLLISFNPGNAISTGQSNFGAFASSQQHCLTPPGTYDDGVFDYAFEAGDMFFGTYSGMLSPSEVEGVLNNAIELVVTGGTGRFLGATGVINGVGTLDRRVPRTVSELTLSGTLDLPAVPEPATWGMMILGLGGVGAALRLRTAGRAAASA